MGEWRGIRSFEWQGYEWIGRPLWGLSHPDDDICWYDESAFHISKSGELVLDMRYKPRTFEIEGRGLVEKPYGRSSVRSTTEFKYGTFEWEMKLPYGKYIWPSLWLSSDEGWPPEIDCMEGWSGEDPNFIKRILWRSIHPTMHWSEGADEKTGKHLQKAKYNIWRWWLEGGGSYDRYKVVWTPEYVDVFYNSHKVNRFKDKVMLKHMNKEGYSMHPIMGISPYGDFSRYYDDYLYHGQAMRVRSFKYTVL